MDCSPGPPGNSYVQSFRGATYGRPQECNSGQRHGTRGHQWRGHSKQVVKDRSVPIGDPPLAHGEVSVVLCQFWRAGEHMWARTVYTCARGMARKRNDSGGIARLYKRFTIGGALGGEPNEYRTEERGGLGEGGGWSPNTSPVGAAPGPWPGPGRLGRPWPAWRFVYITPDVAGMRRDYRSLRGVRCC